MFTNFYEVNERTMIGKNKQKGINDLFKNEYKKKNNNFRLQ